MRPTPPTHHCSTDTSFLSYPFQRKAEVTRAMWKMLKKDEEDLAARRKLAAEERAARKTEKKKQHHGKPVEEAVDLIEGAVERVEGG